MFDSTLTSFLEAPLPTRAWASDGDRQDSRFIFMPPGTSAFGGAMAMGELGWGFELVTATWSEPFRIAILRR